MTLSTRGCIKCSRHVSHGEVCPDYPDCKPIPIAYVPKEFIFRKYGNARPPIVCSALQESDWLFVVSLNGVELGHAWQPTLRVPGMPGYCPSEGYKGAFWHPDGTLHLAQTGKNPKRPRVYHNTRPDAAAAIEVCYHQARVTG